MPDTRLKIAKIRRAHMSLVQEFQTRVVGAASTDTVNKVMTSLALPEGLHVRDVWPAAHLWSAAVAADTWNVIGRLDFRLKNSVVLSIPIERGFTASPASGSGFKQWPLITLGPGFQPSLQFFDTQANARNPIVPCERFIVDCDEAQLFIENIRNDGGLNIFLLGLRILTTIL